MGITRLGGLVNLILLDHAGWLELGWVAFIGRRPNTFQEVFESLGVCLFDLGFGIFGRLIKAIKGHGDNKAWWSRKSYFARSRWLAGAWQAGNLHRSSMSGTWVGLLFVLFVWETKSHCYAWSQ